MNIKHVLIPLNKIDYADTTFCVSYPLEQRVLEQSMREYGILSPLIVHEHNAHYRVLSGFRRLFAAQQLNIQQIPVIIAGITGLEAFRCTILENLSHRTFTVFEISTIIDKLLTVFNLSSEEVIRDYLPLFGYQPHKKVLERVLVPSRLSESQKKSLYEAQIEPEKIFMFEMIPSDAWDNAIAILIGLKPGVNKFYQILELVCEIAQREKCSVKALFSDDRVTRVVNDVHRTTSQRLEQLRTVLAKWRNPNIARVEEELRKKYNNLKLDSHIKLTLPPACEGTTFGIEFSFKNNDELHKYADELLKISSDKALEDLIRYIKEL